MEILTPKVERIIQGDGLQGYYDHIARCAAVCYNSKPKTGDAARYFVQARVKQGHRSILRQGTLYYFVPKAVTAENQSIVSMLYIHSNSPYAAIRSTNEGHLVVLNGQTAYENGNDFKRIREYGVTVADFATHEGARDLIRYTFLITTQIGTSRELNRVSPNNILEQSTRYVDMQGGEIVRPWWFNSVAADDPMKLEVISQCKEAFASYNRLLGMNALKENARTVLPLATATKVIYTYTAEEWKRIIDIRYHGTTGTPHPDAKEVIGMVRDELNALGYGY